MLQRDGFEVCAEAADANAALRGALRERPALCIVDANLRGAFVAIRDHDIAAELIGIDIFRYKLLAFAVSSFYAGVTGVLYTYYLGVANYEQFQLVTSIDYVPVRTPPTPASHSTAGSTTAASAPT